ncbi:MAG TPA: SDR family NAD(P)-dependent oxidoreductase [Galbitalea sp.]|jgi:protochlorophyllide reductase
MTHFEVPRLDGRVALVTGATGGLGLEVARVLAVNGASVILGSRTESRGLAAVETIAAHATVPPRVVALDLASLASVRDAASRIRDLTGDRLDLLVNNGGIMAPPLGFSVDGFELQWATNVIGPAALTWQLLPALEETPGSRVVFVSSDTHRRARLADGLIRDDVRGENYRGFPIYARTKLADLLVANELQAHFDDRNSGAISVAAHPGFSATGIVSSGFAGLPRFAHRIAAAAVGVLGQPVAMGAMPILLAATGADVKGGQYFGPTHFGELRGPPGPAHRSAAATDRDLGRMLVARLEEYTGVRAPA